MSVVVRIFPYPVRAAGSVTRRSRGPLGLLAAATASRSVAILPLYIMIRGLGLTKRAIQAAAGNSLDAQLDLERDLQREAGRTADYAEGVVAFLDKRRPEFTGR